jgi:cobyric acid synthase
VAFGRKNYLFAGSDAGAERAAVICSLVGSAKMIGLDPQAYLRHVIERIADHPVNRVDDLCRGGSALSGTSTADSRHSQRNPCVPLQELPKNTVS